MPTIVEAPSEAEQVARALLEFQAQPTLESEVDQTLPGVGNPATVSPSTIQTLQLTDADLDEHAAFVERFYGKKSNTDTKCSAAFDSARNLHETASRLSDGGALIRENAKAILDFKVGTRKSIKAVKKILNLVPLIEVAAGVCSKAATDASPIGQSKEVHRRLAVERERAIKCSRTDVD